MVNNYWPFPTKDNPLTPWTPKQVREELKKYAEEQLKRLPDAFMVSNHS